MPLPPELHARHPGLTLDPRLSDTRAGLIEGSFDLALRSAPLADSSLTGRKLADDARAPCASPGCLAAHGAPRSPEGLAGRAFIAWADLAPRELIDRRGRTAMPDPAAPLCRTIIDDGAARRARRPNGG